MKPLKICDIVAATGGKLLSGDMYAYISGICTDSRKITENSLFVPIVGDNFDGHNFIEAAFKQGSTASLTSKGFERDIPGKTLIQVENTVYALGKIAALYRSYFSIPAVSITGSVGKTTTKEMICAVLSEKYSVHKNKGNFNNEIGVPLTLFELSDEHDILVSEMGMSGFGEIDRISAMVKPEIVVMTNIGMSHIELLGSQENIYKAKTEFLPHMNPKGTVVLNGDDSILMAHCGEMGKDIVTIGVKNKNADITAENIKVSAEGISFDVCGIGDKFGVELFVPGEHNVYNALLACACGMLCDVPTEKMQKALSEFTPTAMRMATIKTDSFTIINDCYNAAPDSMAAALKVLGAKDGRRVAVLGDIACLGKFSYDAHRALGAEIIKNDIDILVTIGKEARYIAESAFEYGMDSEQIYSFDDCAETIKKINYIVEQGDVLLVKASRVMELERITEYLAEL